MSSPVSGFDATYESWLASEAKAGTPLIPAATVVLLRDAPAGLDAPGSSRSARLDAAGSPRAAQMEVLMLRRNAAVEFAGGMWVFPGGRIDPEDHEGTDDLLGAARNACVREASEEAGQVVDVGSLVWFSHWCPPPTAPKRFATFFFVCRALGDEVTIDGSEIHAHEWMTPASALARQQAKEVQLAPPTWITLHYLSRFTSVADALDAFAARAARFYETRMMRDDQQMCFVWQGDAAYPDLPLTTPGPRHRITAGVGGWQLDDSAVPF